VVRSNGDHCIMYDRPCGQMIEVIRGIGVGVQTDRAIQRWPAAPKAAPVIALSAKFLFASGIKIAWSVQLISVADS
jgi:hypothetical protein